MKFFPVAALLAAARADLVTYPAAGDGGSDAQLSYSTSERNGTTGYLATVGNPISHFSVMYHAKPNSTECGGYERPSVAANAAGCAFAVNGGPFSMGLDPVAGDTCMGYVVADGVEGFATQETEASFGLTTDGTFVMGVLSDSDYAAYEWQQLLTGFDWLVQAGESVVTDQGGEVAPRTAIGVDKDGRLLVFAADGIEKSSPPQGLTLYDAAAWFAELDVYHAINLDGGGSTVVYYNGSIANHPTCIDTRVFCERAVTTSVCIA